MNGQNQVVVGLQWGDEGKGKIVDLLARSADMVVRFQGGNNAGHTLVVDGQKVVLHLVPSGILHPGVRGLIGGGVVLDPEVFCQELAALQARGVDVSPGRLLISGSAHTILPVHRLLDHHREEARGANRIGTVDLGHGHFDATIDTPQIGPGHLQAGWRIPLVDTIPDGVDTPADLERARDRIAP